MGGRAEDPPANKISYLLLIIFLLPFYIVYVPWLGVIYYLSLDALGTSSLLF